MIIMSRVLYNEYHGIPSLTSYNYINVWICMPSL